MRNLEFKIENCKMKSAEKLRIQLEHNCEIENKCEQKSI